MRRLFVTLVVGLVLGACSGSEGGEGGGGGRGGGTATEQTLCSDLAAGAPQATLYHDAIAVSKDLSTGLDDLSVDVAFYLGCVCRNANTEKQRTLARMRADCSAL